MSGKFAKPRGRPPAGKRWDDQLGAWQAVEPGMQPVAETAPAAAPSRKPGRPFKQKVVLGLNPTGPPLSPTVPPKPRTTKPKPAPPEAADAEAGKCTAAVGLVGEVCTVYITLVLQY